MPLHIQDLARLAAAARFYVEELTPAQAFQRVAAGALWVDVREPHELLRHAPLPGAVHLPRCLWERHARLALPDDRQALVVYSGQGVRSALAALSLGQQGYGDVAHVRGGLRALMQCLGDCPPQRASRPAAE